MEKKRQVKQDSTILETVYMRKKNYDLELYPSSAGLLFALNQNTPEDIVKKMWQCL